MSDQQDLLLDQRMATPEEIEAARLARAAYAAQDAPRSLPLTGHTLEVQVLGATIVGDEIHMSVKVHGQLSRPGQIAIPARAVVSLHIPAEVLGR